MVHKFLFSFIAVFLISVSRSVIAWGWGQGDGVRSVIGETKGDVTYESFDVGTGPCAAFPPAPDPLPPIGDPPTFANIQTKTLQAGRLKGIGWVAVDTKHCAEGPYARNGEVILHTKHGSIEGFYESETIALVGPEPQPPLYLPVTGSVLVQAGAYMITGGTGRYEGVIGRLEFQVFVDVGEWGFAEELTWTIRQVIAGHIQFPE